MRPEPAPPDLRSPPSASVPHTTPAAPASASPSSSSPHLQRYYNPTTFSSSNHRLSSPYSPHHNHILYSPHSGPGTSRDAPRSYHPSTAPPPPMGFTLMVAGSAGARGKTSLLRLFLDTSEISPLAAQERADAVARFVLDSLHRTDSVKSCALEVLVDGAGFAPSATGLSSPGAPPQLDDRQSVLLTLVDTPSIDTTDHVGYERSITEIMRYVEARFSESIDDEHKARTGDHHVHLCFYLLDPDSIVPVPIHASSVPVHPASAAPSSSSSLSPIANRLPPPRTRGGGADTYGSAPTLPLSVPMSTSLSGAPPLGVGPSATTSSIPSPPVFGTGSGGSATGGSASAITTAHSPHSPHSPSTTGIAPPSAISATSSTAILRLNPLDVQAIKELSLRVNVLPVIACADTITSAKLACLKRAIRDDLARAGIGFGIFDNEFGVDGVPIKDPIGSGNDIGSGGVAGSEGSAVKEEGNGLSPVVAAMQQHIPVPRLPHAIISPDAYAQVDGTPSPYLSTFSAARLTFFDLLQRYAPTHPTNSAGGNGGPGSAGGGGGTSVSTPTSANAPNLALAPSSPIAVEIKRGKFTRRFRWGVIDVLDPEHCDFASLRSAVFHHMQPLRTYTRDYLFEKFRVEVHHLRQHPAVTPTYVHPGSGVLSSSARQIHPSSSYYGHHRTISSATSASASTSTSPVPHTPHMPVLGGHGGSALEPISYQPQHSQPIIISSRSGQVVSVSAPVSGSATPSGSGLDGTRLLPPLNASASSSSGHHQHQHHIHTAHSHRSSRRSRSKGADHHQQHLYAQSLPPLASVAPDMSEYDERGRRDRRSGGGGLYSEAPEYADYPSASAPPPPSREKHRHARERAYSQERSRYDARRVPPIAVSPADNHPSGRGADGGGLRDRDARGNYAFPSSASNEQRGYDGRGGYENDQHAHHQQHQLPQQQHSQTQAAQQHSQHHHQQLRPQEHRQHRSASAGGMLLGAPYGGPGEEGHPVSASAATARSLPPPPVLTHQSTSPGGGGGYSAGQTHQQQQNGGSSGRVSPDPGKQKNKKITVACNFCRSRKLKCDGGRPACSQCVKRSNNCDYMTSSKRRGINRGQQKGDASTNNATSVDGAENDSGAEQSGRSSGNTGPASAVVLGEERGSDGDENDADGDVVDSEYLGGDDRYNRDRRERGRPAYQEDQQTRETEMREMERAQGTSVSGRLPRRTSSANVETMIAETLHSPRTIPAHDRSNERDNERDRNGRTFPSPNGVFAYDKSPLAPLPFSGTATSTSVPGSGSATSPQSPPNSASAIPPPNASSNSPVSGNNVSPVVPIRPASDLLPGQRKRAGTGGAAGGSKGSSRSASNYGPKVVACNFCRARKTKCDGGHPSCSSCFRRSLQCQYINEPGANSGGRGKRANAAAAAAAAQQKQKEAKGESKPPANSDQTQPSADAKRSLVEDTGNPRESPPVSQGRTRRSSTTERQGVPVSPTPQQQQQQPNNYVKSDIKSELDSSHSQALASSSNSGSNKRSYEDDEDNSENAGSVGNSLAFERGSRMTPRKKLRVDEEPMLVDVRASA